MKKADKKKKLQKEVLDDKRDRILELLEQIENLLRERNELYRRLKIASES